MPAESINHILRSAGRHAKKGEIELAVQKYQSVLSRFPGNKRASDGLKALQKQNAAGKSAGMGPTKSQIDGLVALYKQGRLREALAQGETLARRFPQVSMIAKLLGAVNLGLGNAEEAVACFSRVVNIEPQSAESWYNLGGALRATGSFQQAVTNYRKALQIKPDHAEAQNNLGLCLYDLGMLGKAAESYREALRIKPKFAEPHFNLGNVLSDMGKFHEAVSSYRCAVQVRPEYVQAHNNLGNALKRLGKFEEAAASYQSALQIKPDYAEANNNLGVVLRSLGKPGEAASCFEAALQVRPDFCDAHKNLSTVRKYRDSDPHLRQMLELLERPNLSARDRIYLDFALAKGLDDVGEYDRAFACLLEGNRLRKEELGYKLSSARSLFSQVRAIFAESVSTPVGTNDGGNEVNPRPLFVLGMPRSGTSLVEQILASHSRVYGGGELELLSQAVAAIQWDTGPLATNQVQAIRQSYLAGLSKLEVPEPVITDKMPGNFLWIGFILAAMPEARIVHVIRDARATCWSNFKHYYSGNGNGFTYDLEDLALYYKMYADLMAFWHDRYPQRIYDLHYETLINHQREETRKLLDHVGLDWEVACLDFYKTERGIGTASALQVREPMYRESSEKWRKYEHLLQSQSGWPGH
jgi:tetratricopeptide (TPR) repeat protein